jgi:hypothetical protein
MAFSANRERKAHYFAIKGHEVEMPNPLGAVVLHLLREHSWTNHFADILVHESIPAVTRRGGVNSP